MIQIINNKIVLIDENANIIRINDEALEALCHNIKEYVVQDDLIFNQEYDGDCEDIYYYIVEKIYTMQDYPKWNDVPFKDKPKAKLVIALNKFVYDKINGRTE